MEEDPMTLYNKGIQNLVNQVMIVVIGEVMEKEELTMIEVGADQEITTEDHIFLV